MLTLTLVLVSMFATQGEKGGFPAYNDRFFILPYSYLVERPSFRDTLGFYRLRFSYSPIRKVTLRGDASSSVTMNGNDGSTRRNLWIRRKAGLKCSVRKVFAL
ncbi:hypothetical protein LY76DRAFT_597881 [Colletotrichum caudatum]|nr:hypothetical protein LY76DRAFT_597881 [Colletotrichum caudatum]